MFALKTDALHAPLAGDTYEALVAAFLAHGRETPALLEKLIREFPDHPRPHATRALMLTLLGRSEVLGAAREAAETARVIGAAAGSNEKAFAEAALSAAHGDWHRAVNRLEAALVADPADSLAAKMSHAFRFMLGDKKGMLRSAHQVMRRLPVDHAHRGFLLGCQAFALEENGFYTEAERTGRQAVAMEPRDAWGLHAVSHVHEMTGRPDDGIAWIAGHENHIAGCNNFGGHLFWHLALFKLEKGAFDEVFALYDAHIRAEKTDDFRDIANGASLLMRLEIEGRDVGTRWEELADKAEARLDDRAYVFADLHYLLALLGAGRQDAAETLVRSIAHGPARHAAQNSVASGAGALLAEGIAAFSRGDMNAAADKLMAARGRCVSIGGSDAQRDVFEQVTIEALIRAGDARAASGLLNERLNGRSTNRFAAMRLKRLARGAETNRGAAGLVAALAFAVPAH